jgi:DNA-binding HxlR family transcriptional regulator
LAVRKTIPKLASLRRCNPLSYCGKEEAMTHMAYGQYCGLARALEVVGEPWALLVIRDLTVTPKSSAELREGLPGISKSTLDSRLRELEYAGVIRRSETSGSDDHTSFELTEYGSELEDLLLQLGRWGAKTIGGPRRGEVVTNDSVITALRSMFSPEATRGIRINYQLNLGDIVINARINDGDLEVGSGPMSDADLILEAGPALRALMAGEMSPREALESGGVRLTGDPRLLEWFVEMFHIPPAPPGRYPRDGLPASISAGLPRGTGPQANRRVEHARA